MQNIIGWSAQPTIVAYLYTMGRRCGYASAKLLFAVWMFAAPVGAADLVRTFNIPAQSAATGLNEFARQADITLAFSYDLVSSEYTQAVQGDLTVLDALGKLLKGTKLGYKRVSEKTIAINVATSRTADAPVQKAAAGVGVVAATTSDPSQANQNVPSANSKEDASKQLSDDSKGLAEILVRGSRITNVDVTRTADDVQPYYVFNSQTIEQSGASDVEDFLKQRLTMNTVGLTSSQKYGPNSLGLGTTSTINLRGLGTNETLILIDGRRRAGVTLVTGGFSNVDGQPDLNEIPLAAIERIEVLPSSASAIYGGNAIGGVVNVILKKNYDGGQIRANYDNTFRGNAPIPTVDASYGASLEGGLTHIMVTAHYANSQPLLLRDRSELTERGVTTILANSPSFFTNFDSFTGGQTSNIESADLSNLVLKNGTPLGSPITHLPQGANSSTNLAPGLLANAGSFDYRLSNGTGQYGLLQPIGSTSRNTSLMISLRREMAPWIDLFVDTSLAENKGSSVYNQTGDEFFSVPSTAPTNPFSNANGVDVTIPSTLSTQSISDSKTFAFTGGGIVRLPHEWGAEADYTWSQNRFDNSYSPLDYFAITDDLASGKLNPFIDTVTHPQNLASYAYPQSYSGSSGVNDLSVHASGPLIHFPWGAPTLTAGLEHRKEGYPDNTQYYTQSAGSGGNSSVTFLGKSQTTNSVYAELNAPLVTAANSIPGISSLEVQLAFRSEHYSVHTGPSERFLIAGSNPSEFGYVPALDANGLIPVPDAELKYQNTSPTIGIKYQPTKDIVLRSSVAEAFLPPTYGQLLPDPVPSLFRPTIYDPQTRTNYDVAELHGGNASIKPQHSHSLDIGVIVQPSSGFLQGLRMNVEYYKIKQSDFITNLTPQQIVDSIPSRVTRDPVTGRITLIDNTLINANNYSTRGWDLSFDYRRETHLGVFGFYAIGTLISHEYRQLTFGAPTLDYVGWANSGGDPSRKASATFSWSYMRWAVNWTTNWISSYKQVGAPGDPTIYGGRPIDPNTNPQLTGYTDAQGGDIVPSQTYHNLFASYSFGEVDSPNGPHWRHNMLSNLSLQAGIKNILNKAPPLDVYNAPFFYSPYGDIRMRSYWLTVKKDF
jgi:iron complex outermembrane receptor protein